MVSLNPKSRIAKIVQPQPADSFQSGIGPAVNQLQKQPPIEIGRESLPSNNYQRSYLPAAKAEQEAYYNTPSNGEGLADFNRSALEWRDNPIVPDQGEMVMLRQDFQDMHNREVVKELDRTAIRYEFDPNTGQEIPVTYIPKAKDFMGNVTEWETRPMSQGAFNTLKNQQSVPITERTVLRNLSPEDKARHDEALLWGHDTSEFYRPLDFSTVDFTENDFLTVRQSLREADAIARSGLARGTENMADLNRIPVDALDTAASPNYAALGQRSILVSDQGRINDQYRQELGEAIPKSPHLQNKRALMPASDRLETAAQWKTQPQPEDVTQLDSSFRQFDPKEVKGFIQRQTGYANSPPEHVSPSTNIDRVEALWQKQRAAVDRFDSTQEFITPTVLDADTAYQHQLRANRTVQEMGQKAAYNEVRNRRVEAIPAQPSPEIEDWVIPGVYIPSTQHPLSRNQPMSGVDAEGYADAWQQPQLISRKLEPYVPKLNSTNDDYDWDAFDSDVSLARIELDGEYYPLMPEATINVAGKDVYNNLNDHVFGQPDIMTAIKNKERELGSIHAQLQSMRTSPTAPKHEELFSQLNSRAQQIQAGIQTARSAHDKLIGIEPLPEVRVIANPLPAPSPKQDPEIEAMYQAGLADRDRRQQQRMQEIGMPVSKPRMVESAVNTPPQIVDTPLTAADAVYKRMKTRSWGTPQPDSPQPQTRGIEGSFGRMRSAVPQSMPVGPVDPRFVPDPFSGPMTSQASQPQSFSTPRLNSPLMLPPAHTSDVRDVPVAPLPPPRSAAEAAFRQWQPQADGPIAPRQRPQESPSWMAPAAMAGGAGLIGIGGLTLYHQREQEKQMQKEAELRRAMGRG